MVIDAWTTPRGRGILLQELALPQRQRRDLGDLQLKRPQLPDDSLRRQRQAGLGFDDP